MGNVLYKTNQEIPEEMILGNLLFTNLVDMKIPISDLKSIFQSNKLSLNYIKDLSPADVFRRATSSIKGVNLNLSSINADKSKVEIDEVKTDYDEIKRLVGIKNIDMISEGIEYVPVAEIVFNRFNNTCTATPTIPNTNADYKEIENLCNLVESRFSEWSIYHNKDTIKNIINKIISSTHPVNLMPTGLCKFVPKLSSDVLYNLKQALKEMTKYSINNNLSEENVVEIIPVINTDEQKSLIEKNFSIEIKEEMFNFTQELKEVLQKKQEISSRTINSYIQRLNYLKEKVVDYESILGIYVESIHNQIKETINLVKENSEDNI